MEVSEPFLDMQIAYLTPLSLNFLTYKEIVKLTDWTKLLYFHWTDS